MTDTIAGPLPPFIPELRAAIRENLKTQTRRVIKEPVPEGFRPTQYGKLADTVWGAFFDNPTKKGTRFVPCRYGEPGQVRYLREPLCKGNDGNIYYKDDDWPVYDINIDFIPWRWKVNTLSGLFMPAEYARTFVKVIRIHAERVQDICGRDALDEGVSDKVLMPANINTKSVLFHATAQRQIVEKFVFLWQKINAERGYSWESNPWVWVLEFAPINPLQ